MSSRRGASAGGLVLIAAMASGGCVAAAPLISAAISAAPLIGGRSVERTVAADRPMAWQAVETALADLAFRIEGREQENDEWRLRGVAHEVTVEVRLAPVTSRLTRVLLRVETGGPFADRRTAEVIHDHIVKIVHAAGRPAVTDSAPSRSDEAIRSLETEVRRLRTDIDDQSRGTRQAVESSPPSQPPAMRVERSAVVTAPLSAALPSVAGGAAPPISVIQPAAAIAPAEGGVPVVTPAAVPREAEASYMTDRVGPARPAEALVPVAPVSQSRSGS
jgi:hypothetical protein